MNYRAEIDGLRAVAVLPVILFHAGFVGLPGGFVGVDVFFVISGYLITCILMDEIAENRFSLLGFYERRARRILPALFLVMLACVPFAWVWLLEDQLEEFADSFVAVALFLSNVEFWRQSGYFASEAANKPLLHTWSLGIEEQFYILFPLLLWGLAKARLRPVALLAGLALASLALSEWGWRHAPDANFFLIPFRAWELLAGALVALWGGRSGRAPDDRLALSGLALILLSLLCINEETPFPSLWTLLPVGGTAMVILWGGAGSTVARLLSWRPAVAIGLISYSAYLWHQPVFAFARIRAVADPSPATMALLTLLTFLLAWATWKWVEIPFRRRPVPLLASRMKLFVVSGALLGSLVIFGLTLRQVDKHGIRNLSLPGMTVAERAALNEVRHRGIRTDTCHYNRERSGVVQEFLTKWSCTHDDEPALVSLPIGIFGDSHAADKAHAIRLSGFDIAQLTAAGCPLVPTSVQRPHCDEMREAFVDQMQRLGVTTVFLSNFFKSEELTPDYLARVVDYWSPLFEHVYLFSPMPVFPDYEQKLRRFPAVDLAEVRPDPTTTQEFEAAIASVDLKGVIVLETDLLFCGVPANCAPADTETLLTDPTHLSAYGAAKFGRALVDLPGGPFSSQ